MDTNEFITLAGVFIGGIIAGAIGYLKKRPTGPAAGDPVIAGIAMGFGDQKQLAVLERMAVALETLADKRTDEMEEIHQALLDRLDAQERREEQEEPRPRPHPRRR